MCVKMVIACFYFSLKAMSKLEPHTGISHRMHLSHLQSWEKTLSTPHDKAIVEHAIKTLC